jgi:hypothetical protein
MMQTASPAKTLVRLHKAIAFQTQQQNNLYFSHYFSAHHLQIQNLINHQQNSGLQKKLPELR